ncbi:MAG TPA: DUF3617 family protein [Burkholderiales bacterium]|nr:DUF3617 family protein [Burkholderiales bacterium]
MKTILALLAMLPIAPAHAANDGELWESTVQMNIPGMPAGMGARKQQVCTEKGDVKKAAQKGNEKCKVTDVKESGNKTTMTMQCPEGTAVMEWNYNAAHTEYTGSMKMKTKDGDMAMTMAGKKIGACDAQAETAKRDESTKKALAAGAAQQAEMNRLFAQGRQKRLTEMKTACEEGLKTMDYQKFVGPLCLGKQTAGSMECHPEQIADAKSRELVALPPEGKTFCEAKKTEFCKNLQTEAGFNLATKTEHVRTGEGEDENGKVKILPAAQRIPDTSAFCGFKNATVAANLCSKAVEGESWGFLRSSCPVESKSAAAKLCPRALATEHYHYLGAYCPAEAKPLYVKYCAGRDYTSMYKGDKKQFAMCSNIGIAMEEERERTSPKGRVNAAKETVNTGVQQGLGKLKGLFGK